LCREVIIPIFGNQSIGLIASVGGRWLMEAHPHKIAELEKGVADPLMACLLHGLQVAIFIFFITLKPRVE